MFANVGVATSAAVVCGLIAGVSVIPTIYLQYRGKHHRHNRATAAEEKQAVADAEA